MTESCQPSPPPAPQPHPLDHPIYGPLVPITLTLTLRESAHLFELAARAGICPNRLVARFVIDESVRQGISERDALDGRWVPRQGQRDPRPGDAQLNANGKRPWEVRLDAFNRAWNEWAETAEGEPPSWSEAA